MYADTEGGRARCAQELERRVSWLACSVGAGEWDPVRNKTVFTEKERYVGGFK